MSDRDTYIPTTPDQIRQSRKLGANLQARMSGRPVPYPEMSNPDTRKSTNTEPPAAFFERIKHSDRNEWSAADWKRIWDSLQSSHESVRELPESTE